MNIYYYTFGCKVNQYETENIREQFEKSGFGRCEEIADADICIINTCTVTAQSDSKCRQLIHKIRKENPRCVLVIAGCMTQAFPELANSLSECDIIVGSQNKTHIPALVNRFLSEGRRIVEITPHKQGDKIEQMTNSSAETKTRAYIKIQDGCDMNCTYCIIPKARGHIRSKPIDEITQEVMRISAFGHKEIILTGINLCCYGRDFKDGTRLIDAIEAACSVEGDFRVRLGSIEPEMISDSDIERMSRLEKLCPQFHLSLQSGCTATLKAMNRHYTAEEYGELCEKLRKSFKGCAITTDIMVGFPGETEENFMQSLAFAKKIAFADAHIFPYSRRKGTVADKMQNQIDGAVKKERASKMSAVCAESKKAFLQSRVGTVQRVLFEKENSPLWHNGHAADYTVVKVPRKSEGVSLRREFRDVKILSVEKNFCIGEIVHK